MYHLAKIIGFHLAMAKESLVYCNSTFDNAMQINELCFPKIMS